MTFPKWVGPSSRACVSASILAVIVWKSDWVVLTHQLAGLSAWPLVVALGVLLAGQSASAVRFACAGSCLNRRIRMGSAVRIHFIGLFFNQLLPTGLGGDVVKVLLVRRRMGVARGVRVVLIDRGSGLIAILLGMAVFLPFYHRQYADPVFTGLIAIIGIGSLASLTFLVGFSRSRYYASFVPRSLRWFILPLRDIARFMYGTSFKCIATTSLLVHLSGIGSYALIGYAFGLQIGLIEYVLLVPVVFLIALLPISIGGWGVREVGAIGVFSLAGISHTQSMTVSIVFGILMAIAGLPGLLYYITSRDEFRPPATA